MPTFKVTLSYDGTGYVGWQRQANGLSIQAVLEHALRELDGRDVAVAGAGRTDAGVHALGQVAAFTLHRALPADSVVRALNARLPAAIRVLSAEEAPAGFHPRFSTSTKTYRYRIWTGQVISPFEHRYAWHLRDPLDMDAMSAAARLVEGTHDFAAFQATGSDVATTVRRVLVSRISDCGLRIPDCGSRIADRGLAGESGIDDRSAIDGQSAIDDQSAVNDHSAINPQSALRHPQSGWLVYDVTGDGFLRHMVRTIVGTLVEVGRGRQPVEWMARLLVMGDRRLAGPTAPAAGLFLVRVDYPTALAAGS